VNADDHHPQVVLLRQPLHRLAERHDDYKLVTIQMSALSFATTAPDVPAGAITPNQLSAAKPLRPAFKKGRQTVRWHAVAALR